MIVLTVLDFEDGLVYQYHIETDNKNMQVEDFEKIMLDQGHRIDDCEWMFHSDGRINMQKIEL